jgi:hypothetical protein
MDELQICNKTIWKSGLLCLRISGHVGPCTADVMPKRHPETLTIWSHYHKHSNPKSAQHQNYKNQVWFAGWDPKQGGTLEAARQWLRANLPCPGPEFELHVIKTKEHPYGYFAPGGLMWIHKRDRHDKDLCKLVEAWSNEQWEEFKQQEDIRRYHQT